ncbi:MAG: stage V sporulation protein B [Clostridia bacterium]|nr:MAG: stage V sporulation protein B [Clostridia bacterium]
MNRQSVIYGTLVLAATGLLNRILGFAYRILVVRLVGAEGIGLYEMVFPAYVLMLVITTAGIPVAIARIVAAQVALGKSARAQRFFRFTFWLLCLLGLTVTVALNYLAPVFVPFFFADPRAYQPFRALTPAILIVSLCSALRGLFQGRQQMTPPALAQLAEQVVRIVVGLSMASLWLTRGVEYAATGLAVGMVAGEGAGFLFLAGWYLVARPGRGTADSSRRESLLPLVKEMYALALPVSLSRIVGSVTLTLEAMLIPQRLQAAGYALRQATEIYGYYAGMAMTLVHLPNILTSSLAVSMVPAIAAAMAVGNTPAVHRRCQEAVRVTVVTSLPFAAIFYLLPYQLTSLIFAAPEAGLPLRVLAMGSFFFYLQQTTAGILQGLGRVNTVLRHSLVSNAITLAGIYFLTGLPAYGIAGTALAVNVGAAVFCWLNISAIKEEAGLSLPLVSVLFSPLAATVLMAGTLLYTYARLAPAAGPLIGTGTSLGVGLTVYLGALLLTGGLTRRDLQRLPWIGHLFG